MFLLDDHTRNTCCSVPQYFSKQWRKAKARRKSKVSIFNTEVLFAQNQPFEQKEK
jgi:hypothetical protein